MQAKEERRRQLDRDYAQSDTYQERERLGNQKQSLLTEQSKLVQEMERDALEIKREALRLTHLCETALAWDAEEVLVPVQQAAEQYRTRNGGGSIICRELLAKAGAAPAGGTAAEDRTADYYKKRPCPELCRICADLCAEFIAAHPEGRHGFYKEDA